AARRQHRDAYADLRAHLADDAFRLLVLDLALAASCAPWDAAEGAEPRGLARFAAVALTRQWRRLLAPGRNLDGLAEARLHEIRIEAKRMRYAAELFAPLFPRRESARLMARLKTVQDLLGHLNDGATARSLMARLGGTGQGFAGGAVHGFVAAAGGAQRPGIEEAWRRLRKAPVFWT
ncbi:MAG: CHAD domain-containing protein, partial [Alphaproteobacteria bacterium]|nr:CHAD domain-containing protein [Alphaproteobacteria bacterium]